MTAEIGVLNTIGVALAADSAVTIGSSKVFNSADKLFSLSKHHPIGIMIYGNAEFMGVPWETVIKIFRKKLGDTIYGSLQEYCDNFFEFVKDDIRFYDVKYEQMLIARKFTQFLENILNEINYTVPEIWKVEPNEEYIMQMIYGEALYHFNRLEETANNPGFDDTYHDSFRSEFNEVIEQVVQSRINLDVDVETMEVFIKIAACLVMKNEYSNETGVVIAGFGDDEIFPSLKSYAVEGIFNGVLKYKEEHDVKIDATRSATIVPFAQQEMVHSFLTGIDPDLKRQVVGLIERITQVYPEVVDNQIINLDQQQKESLRNFGSELQKEFIHNVDKMIFERFSSPIIDTVASFPKEELAAMAEALVNLTSIKRKMSYQTETVGGPIDVAVISKGDGFIWIKRKHYFKPELNHTYFTNYMER